MISFTQKKTKCVHVGNSLTVYTLLIPVTLGNRVGRKVKRDFHILLRIFMHYFSYLKDKIKYNTQQEEKKN